ncbi:MAG TPA: gephyrin-like molybdotransferase Glp [Ferruginibacter sp.]|nr:gephyrin-like molybdotransferase Glp [Ferruginibacter sp.]
MISVSEAKNIIANNVQPLQPVTVSLIDAVGLVLAEDVYTTLNVPSFRQSAMDGYGFRFDDHVAEKEIIIAGEVPAGSEAAITIQPQQAVRIFTGAPVPEGVDTVVMQEKVSVHDKQLSIQDPQLVKGLNIRAIGSEIVSGEMALEKETLLSPAAIGFLAGIGVTTVKVYPKPAITIIVTGNELQEPGVALKPGQVYESNSLMLTAILQQLHINNITIVKAADDLATLQNVLQAALQNNNIVLLTGGVSVGDYDFVVEAAARSGVTQLFHKIKQKPGKPLFFGRKENKLVFGLPGNPSSVLTCFYEYVIPALEQIAKQKSTGKIIYLPLAKDYTKKGIFTNFLKGIYTDAAVLPLDAQDSFRLSSFAKANCLICLGEEEKQYKAGEIVAVHLITI